MTRDEEDFRPPRRIPGWLWLALLPAVLIGLNQIRKGGRQRIEIAGAGPVHQLTSERAPQDLRYYPETVAHAPPGVVRAAVLDALVIQPAVLVFSLDLESWDATRTSSTALRSMYAELHRRAENAATVPVSVGPWVPAHASPAQRARVAALHTWWRRGPCQKTERLLCVSLAEASSEAQVLEAMQAGVRSAVRRLAGLRAATQRGR